MRKVCICRCEEITREEIEKAIEDGATTADEVKIYTRAGMGLCQGRTCRRLIERIIAEKTGRSLEEVAPSNYRKPVRPVKMEAMWKEDNKEELS